MACDARDVDSTSAPRRIRLEDRSRSDTDVAPRLSVTADQRASLSKPDWRRYARLGSGRSGMGRMASAASLWMGVIAQAGPAKNSCGVRRGQRAAAKGSVRIRRCRLGCASLRRAAPQRMARGRRSVSGDPRLLPSSLSWDRARAAGCGRTALGRDVYELGAQVDVVTARLADSVRWRRQERGSGRCCERRVPRWGRYQCVECSRTSRPGADGVIAGPRAMTGTF